MSKSTKREAIKVLLIDPPQRKHLIWDPIHKSQSLGLLSLASYLHSHLGAMIDVKIIDAVAEGIANRTLLSPGIFKSLNANNIELSPRLIWDIARDDILHGTMSSRDFIEKYNLVARDNVVRVGLSDADIVQRARDFNPDLIGVNIIASVIHPTAIELITALRREFPEKMILAGGPHPSALPEIVLRSSSGALDFIVQYEGEQVLLNVIKCFPDKSRIKRLPRFPKGRSQ